MVGRGMNEYRKPFAAGAGAALSHSRGVATQRVRYQSASGSNFVSPNIHPWPTATRALLSSFSMRHALAAAREQQRGLSSRCASPWQKACSHTRRHQALVKHPPAGCYKAHTDTTHGCDTVVHDTTPTTPRGRSTSQPAQHGDGERRQHIVSNIVQHHAPVSRWALGWLPPWVAPSLPAVACLPVWSSGFRSYPSSWSSVHVRPPQLIPPMPFLISSPLYALSP